MNYKNIQNNYKSPLLELVLKAALQHKENFNSKSFQKSKLLNVKTGACSEDCKYCAQSSHYKTNLKKEKHFNLEEFKKDIKEALNDGADRFCLGAAWRSPRPGEDWNNLKQMILEIKKNELESCATVGLISKEQAMELKKTGLDFYNHNIDTSPEHYSKVVSTHSFEDRLKTIENVRAAGLKVCSGGILGIGESEEDHISFVYQLSMMDPQPESVPINMLVPIKGTPMEDYKLVDVFTLVRVIAITRLALPKSHIRLSAGRKDLSKEGQALCFLAGANSVFVGDKLLTTENTGSISDSDLFSQLNIG